MQSNITRRAKCLTQVSKVLSWVPISAVGQRISHNERGIPLRWELRGASWGEKGIPLFSSNVNQQAQCGSLSGAMGRVHMPTKPTSGGRSDEMCRPTTRMRIVALLVLLWALFGFPAFAKTRLTIAPGWGSIPEQFMPAIDVYLAANPDVEFEVVQAYSSNCEQLLVWAAGGVLPDVFFVGTAHLGAMVDAGILLPLDTYYRRDIDMSSFLPVFDVATMNGRRYGVPIEGGGYRIGAIFVNRTMFAEGGLPVPGASIEQALGYQQVREYAKRLTLDRNGDGTPEQYGLTNPDIWRFRVLLPTNDARYYSEAYTEVMVDRPEAVEVFSWLADMFTSGFNGGAFEKGQVAMDMKWRAIVPVWRQAIGDSFDWSVAPIPAGRAGSVGLLNLNSISIGATSQHPEEAWKLIRYLMSPAVQERRSQEGQAAILRSAAVKYQKVDSPPYDFTPFLGGPTAPINKGFIPVSGTVWPKDVDSLLTQAAQGKMAAEIALKQAADLLRANMDPKR